MNDEKATLTFHCRTDGDYSVGDRDTFFQIEMSIPEDIISSGGRDEREVLLNDLEMEMEEFLMKNYIFFSEYKMDVIGSRHMARLEEGIE